MEITKTYDYVVVFYQGKGHEAGSGYSASFRRDQDGLLRECPMSDVPVGIKRHPAVLVVP